MNVLLTMLLLVAGTGATPGATAGPAPGDPVKDGLRFYAAGQYGKAVTAFRDALTADPDNARLNYNLALALWRAGDAAAAETAAEKAAALAKGDFDGLRDGILGNLRYDEARALTAPGVSAHGATPPGATPPGATPPGANPPGANPPGATSGPPSEVERLEKAVGLAGTARDDFQRSAVELLKRSPSGCAEVQRNLERAIKLEAELKKRLEDAKKKQKEQQKKNDKNKKNDDKKKKNDKKQDPTKDKKKNDKKNGDKKPDEKKPDEKKEQPEPDPKKRPEADKKKKKPETKPADEKKNKPHKPGKPQEVPGEFDPNKQLTPEQRHELLKRLKKFEASLEKLKAARKAARPKVKKDW